MGIGKDIASYTFDLQSLAPGETDIHPSASVVFGVYPNTDWLRADKNSVPIPDSPMAGSTLHLPVSMILPTPIVMTITGVLFTDRSAIGTPYSISYLLALMKDQSAFMKQRLEFLETILTYEDAVKILRGGDAYPAGRSQGDLTNLRNGLKWNDSPDAWQQYIIKESQNTAKMLLACRQATTLKDAQ